MAKKNTKNSSKADSGSKTASIVIFVILGIVLIIYCVYCFEAYRNDWFPFAPYVQTVPDNAVRPLGDVSVVSQDELDSIQDILDKAKSEYCQFYASVSDEIVLPPNNAIINCA